MNPYDQKLLELYKDQCLKLHCAELPNPVYVKDELVHVITSWEELISLANMGLNYTKKMQHLSKVSKELKGNNNE